MAFKLTKAAAEQGHTAAQYNLGSLYFTGDGTAKDADEAVRWYSAAANSGHPEAAFLLANMYQEGEDIGQDFVVAHAWATTAESADYPDAASLKREIEQQMDPSQLSEAKRLYARWQIN
jgi:TPR repeat protein